MSKHIQNMPTFIFRLEKYFYDIAMAVFESNLELKWCYNVSGGLLLLVIKSVMSEFTLMQFTYYQSPVKAWLDRCGPRLQVS